MGDNIRALEEYTYFSPPTATSKAITSTSARVNRHSIGHFSVVGVELCTAMKIEIPTQNNYTYQIMVQKVYRFFFFF